MPKSCVTCCKNQLGGKKAVGSCSLVLLCRFNVDFMRGLMLACQLLTRHHTLHWTYDLGPFVSDLSAQCFYIPLTLYKGGERGQGGPPFIAERCYC